MALRLSNSSPIVFRMAVNSCLFYPIIGKNNIKNCAVPYTKNMNPLVSNIKLINSENKSSPNNNGETCSKCKEHYLYAVADSLNIINGKFVCWNCRNT